MTPNSLCVRGARGDRRKDTLATGAPNRATYVAMAAITAISITAALRACAARR